MKEVFDSYLSLGAGGVSLLTVVWLVRFIIKKIYPILSSIKEDNSGYKEIIKNNTEAIKEVGRTNDNMVAVIKLLGQSVTQLGSLVDKHDKRAENIENNIIRIDEKLNSLTK